jgi:hypothetical protein
MLSRRLNMSHFTTIKTEILDLEVLKQTLSDLRIGYEEKGKIQGFEGQREVVDIVVKLDGRFTMGFKHNRRKGCYELRGLKEFLHLADSRQIIDRIRQEYAYRKVLVETRKRGFSLIQEERVKPGVITLVLKKVA